MDTKNYEFERFVDLMAKLLLKYADKIDISDIEVPKENEEDICICQKLEL